MNKNGSKNGSRNNKEITKRNNSGDRKEIRKKSVVINASITNRIQEKGERILGAEDTIENIDTTVNESGKCKKVLT